MISMSLYISSFASVTSLVFRPKFTLKFQFLVRCSRHESARSEFPSNPWFVISPPFIYSRDLPFEEATVLSMIKSSMRFLYTSKLPDSRPSQKEKVRRHVPRIGLLPPQVGIRQAVNRRLLQVAHIMPVPHLQNQVRRRVVVDVPLDAVTARKR